jgi:hypothetical protein
MAGGLHHHDIAGVHSFPPAIRCAEAVHAAVPDCEQAAGVETPLSAAPAACSPFAFHAAPCGRCPGTPRRRCCLVLAATIGAGAEGSKFQNLTAPMGEAA